MLGLRSGLTGLAFDIHICMMCTSALYPLPGQNVVYARKLTYNDKVLWPQNLGAVARNRKLHFNYSFTNNLNKTKTNHEQHEFIDI